jgi:hypothetical protein
MQYTFTSMSDINGKQLFSLKPVVRIWRSYKRVELIKRQKSFQGFAMYAREVLISLQTRAKFLATHFPTSVIQCQWLEISTWLDTLWSYTFLFESVHNDDRKKLLLIVAVFLLINHIAVGLLLVRLTINCCLWIVAVYFWVVIFLLNHSNTAQVTPKRRNTVRYSYSKVNILQIWHETGSLAMLPTFFRE